MLTLFWGLWGHFWPFMSVSSSFDSALGNWCWNSLSVSISKIMTVFNRIVSVLQGISTNNGSIMPLHHHLNMWSRYLLLLLLLLRLMYIAVVPLQITRVVTIALHYHLALPLASQEAHLLTSSWRRQPMGFLMLICSDKVVLGLFTKECYRMAQRLPLSS